MCLLNLLWIKFDIKRIRFSLNAKHGSDGQIVRLIQTFKANIPRMLNDMTILISSQVSSRLVFEESNILSIAWITKS
jgi:hypothetical protein